MEAAIQTPITVNTTRFGDLQVEQERVISMTAPIWGFPDSTRFFLKNHNENSSLMWLQSLDDPDLAFVVIPPVVINPEFKPVITNQIRKELEIDHDSDMEIVVILTLPSGRPKEMTANLLAPVVINVRKCLARQILLDPTKYELCWPVFGKETKEE